MVVLAESCGISFAAAPLPEIEQTVPVFRAADFGDSVGINTHLLHPDSVYGARFDLLKQRLLAAHIRHIRDGAMDQHGEFFKGDQAERFKELGKAGIRVTFIFRPALPREFVQGFPARVAPAFEAYELPNELNLQHKVPWVETLQQWMPTLRQLIRSEPSVASYPVIGPSLADMGNDPYRLLGPSEASIDFGNLHKYYRSYHPGTAGYGGWGKPPCDAFRYGSLAYAMCHVAKISGGKPIICTEAGYGSNPAESKQVTPEVQAKYIARMLMLHLKAGIRRTFVYQLADYGTDGFGAFGLLKANGDEKPAFRELRTLMNELEDRPTERSRGPLSVAMSGELTDVESLLFEKSDGSYRLALWIEKPSYDPKGRLGSGTPIDVPAQRVTLTFQRLFHLHRLLTFEASGELKSQQLFKLASSVDVAVRDNLTLVDFAAGTRGAQRLTVE